MKIAVIPDVHNKIRAVDRILASDSFDQVIFLGDIWDDFHDTPDDATDVARWVKGLVRDKRITFLWGNHDISYGFRNRAILCSGYGFGKDCAIWKILDERDFSLWKFFWHAQGFLFSHAGLHPRFLPPLWKEKDITTKNLKEYLSHESSKCLIELNQDSGFHWFFIAGDARRHTPVGIPVGGLLWCDARTEFEPVPNLSQVFGHTAFKEYPTIISGDTGLDRISSAECLKLLIDAKAHKNVALDCHLKFYAVIEDGHLQIRPSSYGNV